MSLTLALSRGERARVRDKQKAEWINPISLLKN